MDSDQKLIYNSEELAEAIVSINLEKTKELYNKGHRITQDICDYFMDILARTNDTVNLADKNKFKRYFFSHFYSINKQRKVRAEFFTTDLVLTIKLLEHGLAIVNNDLIFFLMKMTVYYYRVPNKLIDQVLKLFRRRIEDGTIDLNIAVYTTSQLSLVPPIIKFYWPDYHTKLSQQTLLIIDLVTSTNYSENEQIYYDRHTAINPNVLKQAIDITCEKICIDDKVKVVAMYNYLLGIINFSTEMFIYFLDAIVTLQKYSETHTYELFVTLTDYNNKCFEKKLCMGLTPTEITIKTNNLRNILTQGAAPILQFYSTKIELSQKFIRCYLKNLPNKNIFTLEIITHIDNANTIGYILSQQYSLLDKIKNNIDSILATCNPQLIPFYVKTIGANVSNNLCVKSPDLIMRNILSHRHQAHTRDQMESICESLANFSGFWKEIYFNKIIIYGRTQSNAVYEQILKFLPQDNAIVDVHTIYFLIRPYRYIKSLSQKKVLEYATIAKFIIDMKLYQSCCAKTIRKSVRRILTTPIEYYDPETESYYQILDDLLVELDGDLSRLLE